jgi:raffinose/stachyose/melibiose transport system substrate-binding protein
MPLAGAKDNMIYLTEIYMHGMLAGMTFANDRDGLLSETQRQNIAAYLDGRWNYHRPEVQAALRVVQKLGAQMKPGFSQLVRDDAVQEFMRGDALFIFSGTFDATSLRRLAPFPVGGFRVPQPTKDDPIVGKYLIGRFIDGDNTTGFGFYLNKAGPHRAETIDFLRFLTSYEGGKLFMANSGWISSIDKVPIPPGIAGDLSAIDGYSAGPTYINPGSETGRLFQRELYHLVGPTGSVEEFVDALDRAAPAAMTADLRTERRNQRLTLAPRDVRIAAAGMLAGHGGSPAAKLRSDRLESAQNQTEGLAFMLDYQLRHSIVQGTPP